LNAPPGVSTIPLDRTIDQRLEEVRGRVTADELSALNRYRTGVYELARLLGRAANVPVE
jgi:hypothetical protein